MRLLLLHQAREDDRQQRRIGEDAERGVLFRLRHAIGSCVDRLGHQLLARVKAYFEADAKVEQEPRSEGRQIVMVVAPK